MNFNKSLSIVIPLISLHLSPHVSANDSVQSFIDNRIEITLGSRIQNPYSVDNVVGTNASEEEKQSAVTHLYIKFKPDTANDEALLHNTSNITLSISPLDYELEQGGNYFRDDSRPIGSRGSLYAVVNVNEPLPDVPYDVLDRLVQPEASATQRASISNKGKPRRRLGGSITAWDNESNSYAPIVGMNVTAFGGWFQTYQTTTNASGNFYVPKHFDGFILSYAWENSKFKINNAKKILPEIGVLHGTTLAIPLSETHWSHRTKHIKIKDTTRTLTHRKLAAHAYRAAHHYFYGDILGTTRPFSRFYTPFHTKFEIGINQHKVLNWATLGASYYFGPTPNSSARVLLFPGELKGKSSQYLYYLTLHEMAHTVHFDRILNLWGSYPTYPFASCPNDCVEPALRESWAVGLANQIARTHYDDFQSTDTQPYKGAYTGLINDLIDDDNLPTADQVSGYTVRQIESVLKKADDLPSLVTLLEVHFDNPTENYLQALLNYWMDFYQAGPASPVHR